MSEIFFFLFNSHIARYRDNFIKFSCSFCTKNVIIFCQKIQISVSVPGNVISQTLHCVSVHGYLTSVWSSTSSVVVTTAWVVLSISKTLPYSLNLCLIWHGHVVVHCIFTEAWGYVHHSPIILSIPNPDFPVLYPVLWSHSMDQPFAQWVYPFGMGYGGLAFAQGNPYCQWEPIQMLWWVMQQVLHPGIAPCEVVVVLKNNERVLQTKKNVKFCMKFRPFFILFINMVMSHTRLNLHVNFSMNL